MPAGAASRILYSSSEYELQYRALA